MIKKLGISLGIIIFVGLGLLFVIRDRSSQPVNNTTASASPLAINLPVTSTYSAKVLFIGDVMMARSIGKQITAGKNPFAYAQKTLDSYDLRVANIETTIANPKLSVQAQGKLFTFNSPLASIDTLAKAKIDVAGLANNHTRDYGAAATADTLSNLVNAGIKTAGAGSSVKEAFKPLIVEIPVESNGTKQIIRLAIVALNSIENSYTNVTDGAAGSAYFDRALDAKEIKSAKTQADVVVVFPHWGVEYQTSPSADQVAWGRFFIDSGADVVIGGHPHVIEPTVKYKGKYIVYSMGNFIFDQMEGPSSYGQMIGLNIKLTDTTAADGTHSKRITIGRPKSIPTKLDNSGFPRLL